MVDVVRDADVLDVVVARVDLTPLTEVNVEVVECDWRVSSASSSDLQVKDIADNDKHFSD